MRVKTKKYSNDANNYLHSSTLLNFSDEPKLYLLCGKFKYILSSQYARMYTYMSSCANSRELISLTYRPAPVWKLAGIADGSDQSHNLKYNLKAKRTVFRTCKSNLFFFHNLPSSSSSPICGLSAGTADRRFDFWSTKFDSCCFAV